MLIVQLIQIVFKIDFSKLFNVKNLVKNIFGETQHKTVTQIYRTRNKRNKMKQKKKIDIDIGFWPQNSPQV